MEKIQFGGPIFRIHCLKRERLADVSAGIEKQWISALTPQMNIDLGLAGRPRT